MKKILAALFAVFLTVPAMAADLTSYPSAGGYKDGASSGSWTGIYAGINAGYGWDPSISFRDAVTLSNATVLSNLNTGLAPSGWSGGAGIGYNYQSGTGFVFGVETDIQGANISDSGTVRQTESLTPNGAIAVPSASGSYANATGATDTAIITTPSGCGTSCGSYTIGTATTNLVAGVNTVTLAPSSTINWSGVQQGTTLTATASQTGGSSRSNVDWFGTARVRAGFLLGSNVLAYGTGGLAYGGISNRATTDMVNLSNDTVRLGWTAGAGLEWKVDGHWSLKGEYLYVDLMSNSLSGSNATAAASSAGASNNAFNLVRVGVNYRF